MHILVTNDDGILSPGLLALANAMRPLGRVTVLAPDRNWTASGHVKTLERPLRVREAVLFDGSPGFSSDGAPSDCVALALLGVLPDAVDLVVSGVNPGENIGHDVTYSGTVTAAMEAAISGLPGVAVSLQLPATSIPMLDYSAAGQVARQVVSQVIAHGLAAGTLLNVNVPYCPMEEIRGIRITRQGLRIYRDELVKRLDPRSRPYYWIGGEAPGGVVEEGTDWGALAKGYVSVTPLQLDLTAHNLVTDLRSWDWG